MPKRPRISPSLRRRVTDRERAPSEVHFSTRPLADAQGFMEQRGQDAPGGPGLGQARDVVAALGLPHRDQLAGLGRDVGGDFWIALGRNRGLRWAIWGAIILALVSIVLGGLFTAVVALYKALGGIPQ